MQKEPVRNKFRVLIIEDSLGDLLLIEKYLSASIYDGCDIDTATTLKDGLKLLSASKYNVTLLDRSLPDVDGFGGLHNIQSMFPTMPVIFLTAYQDEKTALEAIKLGAQDYLFKDSINGESIKRSIQYAILRKEFEGVLTMRANFDMLTGLANRMLFEIKLDSALEKIKRNNYNLGILFLDLNGFKQVNDTLGHAAGDHLLKEIGVRLKQSLRSYDTAARFGGDEFAVLLEDIDKAEEVIIVAEKIMDLFKIPFAAATKDIPVGVSIGIATCMNQEQISKEELMKKADSAMYQAKANSGSGYMQSQ